MIYKNICLFVLLLFGFQRAVFANAIITGKIENYNAKVNKVKEVSLSYYVPALHDNQTITTSIDNNGNFKFTLLLNKAKYVELVYNKPKAVFLKPDDSLTITYYENNKIALTVTVLILITCLNSMT